ncbi:hypothetical protein V1478_008827 [Vespula squamosa]|uniref:Uncharacterized protein n=1 Tax=Vespula squamosa TaxID=30214 RepID=A0ABD2AUL8_VESSQ
MGKRIEAASREKVITGVGCIAFTRCLLVAFFVDQIVREDFPVDAIKKVVRDEVRRCSGLTNDWYPYEFTNCTPPQGIGFLECLPACSMIIEQDPPLCLLTNQPGSLFTKSISPLNVIVIYDCRAEGPSLPAVRKKNIVISWEQSLMTLRIDSNHGNVNRTFGMSESERMRQGPQWISFGTELHWPQNLKGVGYDIECRARLRRWCARGVAVNFLRPNSTNPE